MRNSQPSLYGAELASPGLLAIDPFTSTTSPPLSNLAGPTHLPDSTVAQLRPGATCHSGRYHGHADGYGAIFVFPIPDVVFNVIQQVVR